LPDVELLLALLSLFINGKKTIAVIAATATTATVSDVSDIRDNL
jgi:hypothetical protein